MNSLINILSSRLASIISGTMVVQIINFATLFIVGRFYTSDVLGQYSNIFSISVIISAISTGRLELLLVNGKSSAEQPRLVRLIVFLSNFTIFVFSLFLSIFYSKLLGYIGVVSFFLLYLLSTSQVAFQINRMLLLNQNNANGIKWQTINQGVIRSAVQIIGGIIASNSLFLIVSEAISRMPSVYKYFIPNMFLTKIDMYLLKKHQKYIVQGTFSSLTDSLLSLGIFPMIAILYGNSSTGTIFFFQRLIFFPLSIITQAVADVFHKDFLDTINSELRRRVFNNYFCRLIVVSMSIFSLGLIFYPLIILIAPKNYTISQENILVLLLWAAIQTLASPLSRIFIIANKQSIKIFIDILILIVIFSFSVLVGKKIDLDVYITFLSFAKCLQYTFYIFVCKRLSTEHIKIGEI